MAERVLKLSIDQNVLAKFIVAKYLSIAYWMKSATSVIKFVGVKALMG